MLRGTKVLSGSISFDVKENEFDEQTLFNAMKMIEGVIENSFGYVEYRLSVRFPTVYSKITEPVMNTDELHSGTFRKGDSVDFYSHSKNLDVDVMMDNLVKRLERLVYPNEYANLRIRFNYNEFEFSGIAPVIEVQNKKTEFRTIRVDKEENITIDKDLYSEENFFSIEYDEISKRTNLLVFSAKTLMGVSDMIDHLIELYDHEEELKWFSGFGNTNTKMVAKLLTNTIYGDELGIDVRGDELNISRVLDGTMNEEYLIGTNQLLDYMEKVSPLILKEALTEGVI